MLLGPVAKWLAENLPGVKVNLRSAFGRHGTRAGTPDLSRDGFHRRSVLCANESPGITELNLVP